MEKRKSESVKRTAENSPAIYRWDSRILSLSPQSGRLNQNSRVSCGRLPVRALRISAVRYADSLLPSDPDPSTQVLGYFRTSASRTLMGAPCKRFRLWCAQLSVIVLVSLAAASMGFSQTAPEVLKVEPPSWWAGSSVNPLRLMIRGRNLSGAQVQVVGRGMRVLGAPEVNERGTFVFINVAIAPNASPGERKLRIRTAAGATDAPFEILPPLNRNRRFQGFSPADVMYLIMIDRFCDGDLSNNDPPKSRGLYDRNNKFYYHGGDLQGVIDRLPYLKNLGVTAVWLTPWYDNYDHPNQIERKEEKPSTGFHGYNPQDFYAVEEHFGSLAKLRELVKPINSASRSFRIRLPITPAPIIPGLTILLLRPG